MALIRCPECKHEVSDKAEICPNCGYNVGQFNRMKKLKQYDFQQQKLAEEEAERIRQLRNQIRKSITQPPLPRLSKTAVLVGIFIIFVGLCFYLKNKDMVVLIIMSIIGILTTIRIYLFSYDIYAFARDKFLTYVNEKTDEIMKNEYGV